MRPVLAVSAAVAAVAIGYAAGNIRSATALDEHAGLDMRVSAVAGPRTLAADWQDTSPANAAASVQAWPKTVAFLRAKLGR